MRVARRRPGVARPSSWTSASRGSRGSHPDGHRRGGGNARLHGAGAGGRTAPGSPADVYSLALTLYECFCGEHPLIRGGARGDRPRDRRADPARSRYPPRAPEALTEAIDACLDPDPEVRPLASELEAVLAAHVNQLDGGRCPAIEGARGASPPVNDAGLPRVARVLPRGRGGGARLTALIATGAPAPIALAGAGPGGPRPRPRPSRLRAAARARSALGAIGAGEPGVAALIAAARRPLLAPAIDPEAIALPGAAPILGLLGLGALYPALAGLPGAAGRALLGGIGYLWIAAWEELAHQTLLLGPVADRRRAEGLSEHRDHRCRDAPDRRPGPGGRRIFAAAALVLPCSSGAGRR